MNAGKCNGIIQAGRAGVLAALMAAPVFAAQPPSGALAVDTPLDYLQRLDTDGDGRVSLAEYQAWMAYGFEQMDRNGDGVLSADELPGGRGKPITRAGHMEQIARHFARQDADGDGFLSARELSAPPR